MGESLDILRYVAKKYNFWPEDPATQDAANGGFQVYSKLLGATYPPVFAPPEAKPEKIEASFAEWESFLAEFDTLCKGPWFCGDQINALDFAWGALYTQTFTNDLIYEKDRWAALLEQHPNWRAYGERYIAQLPADYLKNRPPIPV